MKYSGYYLIAALLFPALLFSQDKFSYIGAEACGMCHKTEKQGSQLSIWKKSAHAKAFETLKTEKADKIAKEKGFDTPAAKTKECLECHASGFSADASIEGKKFKVEDGVQCETCHGPGSEYKDMKIMKNRELAIKNGMKVYDKMEDLCVQCHNKKSPTYKPIDVAEAWKKIEHNVPAAKK
jgi:hypothetical protein